MEISLEHVMRTLRPPTAECVLSAAGEKGLGMYDADVFDIRHMIGKLEKGVVFAPCHP